MSDAAEMVERVARAIAEADGEIWGMLPNTEDDLRAGQRQYGWADSSIRDEYRISARAAIAAMRESTQAMLRAGGRYAESVLPSYIWEAMIDEALEPAP